MIVATYSIAACDLAAGQWGVATQSKFLAVGSVVPSTHDRKRMVEPSRRRRSHCFAVLTVRAPVTDASVESVPFRLRRTAIAPEFEAS